MTSGPEHPDMTTPPNPTPAEATPAPATPAADTAAPARNRPTRNRPPRRAPASNPARRAGPPEGGKRPARPLHPVLEQLATLYPALFGETPKPLKRGIFQDLLAAHPDALDKDALKTALALHTRSSRYLTVVASGQQRHDLAGQAVEDLAPEHVHHALVEVFRRRQQRTPEDLRPKFRQRVAQAFEASGLSREAYTEKVLGRDEEVNALTLEALADVASQAARDEALLRAFHGSGLSPADFASSYGLPLGDVQRAIRRSGASDH